MTEPAPEFSRPVPFARVRNERTVWTIDAKPDECRHLAARFGLLSLDALRAEIGLKRGPAGAVLIDGTLAADLVQPCVVTLEPVPAHVEDGFALELRPGIDEDEADRLSFETPDAVLVEPLVGEALDLGELAAQYLALALDPYPRAEHSSGEPA